jgi:GTP diphosphokinase / guanosine-3',5'-bis(diphosphate) 3'-diphosphatase
MEADFEILLANVASSDKNTIKKAWELCKKAHNGQKRLSGEDFCSHPLNVALILSSWKLDTTSIVAGLLHDLIEDTSVTEEDITKEFGQNITAIILGVTKVSQVKLVGSAEELFVQNLRKMFMAMASDIRVILVKLADRLHNMRTLEFLPPATRKRKALETLEIYAPLAERLGMGQVKSELEDLAFGYAYPSEYKKLSQDSKKYFSKAEKDIRLMKRRILNQLASQKISLKFSGRKKHLYSLFRKLKRPEIDGDFDKIHDIVALRLITESVADCYICLGAIHNLYRPVVSIGVSDFIAQPKPNGYRSIHTKVFGPADRIVEVQIRTKQMHEEAEFGLAAHWAYSELKSKSLNSDKLDKKMNVSTNLDWVNKLSKWQDEIVDSAEFIKAVKLDALSDRNFIFSPKGDVYDLPTNATPIDFAYAVHTNMGEYLMGSKVNGKIVSFNHKLSSGDVVEILKSKNPKSPNRDWLNFAVTRIARKQIQKSLREKTEVLKSHK